MKNTATPDLKKFNDLLINAYRSWEAPDFGFVERAYASRPYDPLIRRLRDYVPVEELAPVDDDVCFGYFIKGRDALWKLDLSAVGPLGLLCRLKGRVTPNDVLHSGKADLIAFERKILDLLASGTIRLLTFEELNVPVPLNLFNTGKDQVRLYQALFSDRDLAIVP